jgi:hypothetical protein
MKDLILNFSWDKLISLPPSEMLSLLLLLVSLLGLVIFGGSLIGDWLDRKLR